MDRGRRLRKASEFSEVFRGGRSWTHPLLAIRASRNGLDRTRFGFAVSKRLGNAVKRNQIKRRLREAARLVPVCPGWDLVVIARTGAADAGFAELRAALVGLLGRARLLAEGRP